MRQRLLSEHGMQALRPLSPARSALVFDLDGTLAPLMARREDARVPPATAARLHALSRSWSIAVITGRTASDAAVRLGFEPRCLIGNHGAERLGQSATDNSRALQRALDPVREQLRLAAIDLQTCGIEVEDKSLSLALHYRRSSDPVAAVATAGEVLRLASAGVLTSHGHCVVNITPLNAPDKGDAVREVLDEWGLNCALVVGDDNNDESAFLKATSGSVTVRIGPMDVPTAAHFALEFQNEIDQLLDVMLGLQTN